MCYATGMANMIDKHKLRRVVRLKEKGLSNSEIARRIKSANGKPIATKQVRRYLDYSKRGTIVKQ